jgi:hypothetical protein
MYRMFHNLYHIYYETNVRMIFWHVGWALNDENGQIQTHLRYCATNQKVAGSIPDGVMEFFIDINPSDRTMALGSTQPLTEMSTRRISWG